MEFFFSKLFSFINLFPDYLWTYGLWWHPFILIAPTFSLVVCKLFSCFEKYIKFILILLKKLGQSSLEILLVSDYIFNCVSKKPITIISPRWTSIFVFVGAILAGIVFHLFIELVKKVVLIGYRKLKQKIQYRY